MCSVVVVGVLTWATCSPQVGRVSIPSVFIDKQKNDNVAGFENVVDGPLERILAAWRVIHCYSKIPRIRHDLQLKNKIKQLRIIFFSFLSPLHHNSLNIHRPFPRNPRQQFAHKTFSLVVRFRLRLFFVSHTHTLSLSLAPEEKHLFSRGHLAFLSRGYIHVHLIHWSITLNERPFSFKLSKGWIHVRLNHCFQFVFP